MFGLLIGQMFLMALYMMVGYGLYKQKKLNVTGCGQLGTLLIYIVLPCTIAKSFIMDFSEEKLYGLAIAFLLSLMALIVSIVIAKICFKKQSAILVFSAAFSNAGFIGIPLAQAAYGEEGVFYISSFVALLNILQWTYGVYIMTGDRQNIKFTTIMKNPIIVSLFLGIILFITQVELPDIVLKGLTGISAMNAPLAMIILGAYLGQIDVKEMFRDKKLYECALVRLVFIPIVTGVILIFMKRINPVIAGTILIAVVTPTGSNVAIFAKQYDCDYLYATGTVCLSTIISLVTIPLMIGLYGMI